MRFEPRQSVQQIQLLVAVLYCLLPGVGVFLGHQSCQHSYLLFPSLCFFLTCWTSACLISQLFTTWLLVIILTTSEGRLKPSNANATKINQLNLKCFWKGLNSQENTFFSWARVWQILLTLYQSPRFPNLSLPNPTISLCPSLKQLIYILVLLYLLITQSVCMLTHLFCSGSYRKL